MEDSFCKKKGTHGMIGPGGMTCNCCGPSPKDKKKFMRAAHKRVRRYFKMKWKAR